MKIIYRERDSGKARELLETARDMKAVVATDDVERLRNKANKYGIYEVTICSYDDIIGLDPAFLGFPILIHNADKFLKTYFDFSGQNIVGFSATKEA